MQILTLLCSGCCGVKIEGETSLVYKMINKENLQQSLICFTLAVLIIIYL